jgi:glycine/D-amino acid oxidase-like deaminating enzyme
VSLFLFCGLGFIYGENCVLDWLIIGGGIHGTALSHMLLRRGFVVRVLDPHDKPLALWERMAANVGMQYLRSPHVHNLHFDPLSLLTFARTRDGKPLADFIPVFHRPSLALFRAHSQQLIERHKLAELRIQGSAQRLERMTSGWRVYSENGTIESRRIVLAIGAAEQPFYPAWARKMHLANAPLQHVFDADFDRSALPEWSHLVVIGGGIAAAQLALSLAKERPGTITLLMRHPVREHSFDSDPCWVISTCLNAFHAEPDFNRRRAVILAARHTGSMPSEVAKELREAMRARVLRLCTAEVETAQFTHQDNIELRTSSENFTADRVLLATGFDMARPGGTWLQNAVDEYQLPTAACGYPIVDKTLQWHSGLYVSGPLAELEIGPAARNIIGARLAGERLLSIS